MMKSSPPKKKTRVIAIEELDEEPDLGEAAPDAPVSATSDAMFRYLTQGEFPEEPSPSLVRFLAMLVYTTDPRVPTLSDVAAMPFFAKHTQLSKVLLWSADDHWSMRREKTWEALRLRAGEAMAAEFEAFRKTTLGDLSELKASVRKAITLRADNFGTDSKSHELLRAFAGLTKLELELHIAMLPKPVLEEKVIPGQLVPGVSPQAPLELQDQTMDPDEARVAAHAILTARRAKTTTTTE